MKTMYVTVDQVVKWSPPPWFDLDFFQRWVGNRQKVSMYQILFHSPLSADSILWLVLRECMIPSKRVLRKFACICARRTLMKSWNMGTEPNSYTLATLAAVKKCRHNASGIEKMREARSELMSYLIKETNNCPAAEVVMLSALDSAGEAAQLASSAAASAMHMISPRMSPGKERREQLRILRRMIEAEERKSYRPKKPKN